MPGVTVPEAVYGLPLGDKFSAAVGENPSSEYFFTDASCDVFRRGITPTVESLLADDPTRNSIFGDFITREGVLSRAWFLMKWTPEAGQAAGRR